MANNLCNNFTYIPSVTCIMTAVHQYTESLHTLQPRLCAGPRARGGAWVEVLNSSSYYDHTENAFVFLLAT